MSNEKRCQDKMTLGELQRRASVCEKSGTKFSVQSQRERPQNKSDANSCFSSQPPTRFHVTRHVAFTFAWSSWWQLFDWGTSWFIQCNKQLMSPSESLGSRALAMKPYCPFSSFVPKCYGIHRWCFYQTRVRSLATLVSLVKILKLKIRQYFEAGIWSVFCFWCFVEVMKLNICRDFETRFGQYFESKV